jgi:hypothetical protein
MCSATPRLSNEAEQRKLEALANERPRAVMRQGPIYFPQLGERIFNLQYPSGFATERAARLAAADIKQQIRDELAETNGSM